MNIHAVSFDNEGGVTIDWSEDTEQTPEGGVVHSTYISQFGQGQYTHVGTYAEELRQDADELLGWFIKYQRGLVPS